MQSKLLLSSDNNILVSYVNSLRNDLGVGDWNFEEISPAPSIGIEEIRKLQKKLIVKPVADGHRLVVLRDFDKATVQAQNALLKTLEEPPSHTTIALTAGNVRNILETIQSRCEKIILSSEEIREVDTETAEFIATILKSTPGQRLLLLQPYTKTREDALALLQRMTLLLRQQLRNGNILPLSLLLTAGMLKKISAANEYLLHNISYKLTLEILFIHLGEVRH